ncbi:MAG: DegT/DnrJ/EryC1/StrS family aminotransferase [Sphaerochaetaceae bacterium]|nr:DegT/DnrJ/EryC1/StrS family aminotransferase [Sphaerochaetaceae bacterium]
MKTPAILGGESAFREPLHVGKPNLPEKKTLCNYLDRIFNSRWLTNNGPLVIEFREKLEEFLQVKYCIPICNGTIALELAERALCFEDEVILPSFTFVATPHSLQWQRIRPVFADVGNDDVNVDPASIKTLLSSRTKGIIGVHVYGYPCDYSKINKIASESNVKVLYDAAHAFGCEVDGIPYAQLGDASIFSFHATKFFHSFEGGAIATNDEALAEEVRLMSNFGFAGGVLDQVDYLGINGKMTEISAAMGLAMLDSVEEIREKNRQNFELYKEVFAEIEGANLIEPPSSMTKQNWQYVVARMDENRFGLSRDMTVQALRAENIFARRYFYPGCHRMHPYRELYPSASNILPNTERLSEQVISFPTGQVINEEVISRIADCLCDISDNADQIRHKVE